MFIYGAALREFEEGGRISRSGQMACDAIPLGDLQCSSAMSATASASTATVSTAAAGTRTRRNRRHRAGCRRGSVGMRRWAATISDWTMLNMAIWRYVIAGTPPAVHGAIGFIVIQPVTGTGVISVSAPGYDTTGQQSREQPDHGGG